MQVKWSSGFGRVTSCSKPAEAGAPFFRCGGPADAPQYQLLQLAQNFEHLRVFGRFTDVVHVDVANDALLVDDDDGALATTGFFVVDAVLLRDITFGMEIGQQRIPLDAAEGFGECCVAGNAVYADAHDLRSEERRVGKECRS